MKELTKAERHEVYKLALDILKSEGYRFNWACEALRMAIYELNFVESSQNIYYEDIIRHLPEFNSKRPFEPYDTIGIVWWGSELGKAPRIEALTQCIEETSP